VEKIVYIDRPVVQEVEKIVYIDRPFEVVREVLSTENVFSYQNVLTGAYNSSQGGVHTHTIHGKILKNAPLFPSYKCTCTGANASEGVYKTSVPYVFFTCAYASDGGYKTSVLYVFFTCSLHVPMPVKEVIKRVFFTCSLQVPMPVKEVIKEVRVEVPGNVLLACCYCC
jgi:hypothetical protein